MSESGQEKRETSADIADEIRHAVGSMGDEMPYTVSAGTMRRVADRIEAAWKREKAEIEANALAVGRIVEAAYKRETAEIEAAALAVGGVVDVSRNTPGNAAALREALVEIRDTINKWYDDDYISHGAFSVLWDLCSDALAAHARNCDKFADAEAASQAWLDDAKNWDDFGSPKLELYEWLFAPAAELKGEGK